MNTYLLPKITLFSNSTVITEISCDHFHSFFFGKVNKTLFINAQFRFRKSNSTVHAINKLSSIIEEGFECKEYIGSIFSDLTKALDCVSHNNLVHKVKHGYSGKSIRLLKSV